jgi:hypothetical protein
LNRSYADGNVKIPQYKWHQAQKKIRPEPTGWFRADSRVRIPAITDFRAKGTIMGRAGLTAVFGMGTGVTPPVWSPEKWPAGVEAGPDTF